MALFLEGRPVVDLWGGWMDAARTRPWHERTSTNVWSTTKTMTVLTVLVLVERGRLELNAPVARYWPEFAAQGKERIEVRHLLSHTSGVSGLESPATWQELCDHRRAAARMAAQAPWWEPGTASGYHALSQGHLIIDRIFEEQVRGVDLVLGIPLRWGMGYGLPEPTTVPFIPDRKVCYWGGMGGSVIINDLDARMTFAYMMNQMQPGIIGSSHSEALVRATYACLGCPPDAGGPSSRT